MQVEENNCEGKDRRIELLVVNNCEGKDRRTIADTEGRKHEHEHERRNDFTQGNETFEEQIIVMGSKFKRLVRQGELLL